MTLPAQPLTIKGDATTLSFRLSDNKAAQAWRSEVSRAITVPLLFVGAGLYATTDNEWLDRYEVKEERDERLPQFHTHADNFLQYAPIAAVYSLNIAGVKGRHDFVDRTVLLVKSEIIMGVLIYSLKKITAVPRPDTGSGGSHMHHAGGTVVIPAFDRGVYALTVVHRFG